MDARRGPRMVIDPKVRQVGFVTPGSEQDAAAAAAHQDSTQASPSPVMIPPGPLRVLDHSPSKSRPVPIPGRSPPLPPRKTESEEEMPLGSYNPSDVVLGSSPSSVGRASGERIDGAVYLSPASVENLNSSVMEMSLEREKLELPAAGDHPVVLIDDSVKEGGKNNELINESKTANPGDSQKGGELQPKKLKEKTSRAERRALQESQRAAKAAAKSSGAQKKEGSEKAQKKESNAAAGAPGAGGEAKKSGEKEKKKEAAAPPPEKEKRKDVPAPRLQFDDEHKVARSRRRAIVEPSSTRHRVELFRHLPQFANATQVHSLDEKFFQNEATQIHRAVYQVGLKYLTWDIVGGNARCTAMLRAFMEMIRDYFTPPEKLLSRDLTSKISTHVSFLTTCRPLSISMGNAIRSLKNRVTKLPHSLTESEAKATLISQLDTFIQEKIILADREIVKHAVTKIRDGDVVLTHGFSCVVEMILSEAHRSGRKFRVVVVDSRPRLEGKRLLRGLAAQGISCAYTHINAVSHIMGDVTRVFLGCASVLSNGTVYSRVGTSVVAMVAHSFKVPVMICCETYKFHERVQLDSICTNELGDPDALAKVSGRKDLDQLVCWAENEHLQLLNLVYDATPSEYVSMIITELGMVPPTSVPVILREYRKEPTL